MSVQHLHNLEAEDRRQYGSRHYMTALYTRLPWYVNLDPTAEQEMEVPLTTGVFVRHMEAVGLVGLQAMQFPSVPALAKQVVAAITPPEFFDAVDSVCQRKETLSMIAEDDYELLTEILELKRARGS